MKGWHIFVHAVRMVLNNIDVALRVSAVPYGIVIIATLVIFFTTGINFLGVNPPTVGESHVHVTALFVMDILWIVTSVWLAVAWHRFVLLGEVPEGIVPRFRGGLIFKYIGVSLVLGLMALLILLAISMFGARVFAATSPKFGAMLAIPFGLFLVIPIIYRLSPVFPAIAIQKPISFGKAWIATSGQTGTLVLAVVIFFVSSGVFYLPSLLGSQLNPHIDLVFSLVMDWLFTMFAISILTTLYIHYIEGRALD